VKQNKKKKEIITSIPGVKKTALSLSAEFAALFTDTAIYLFETSTGCFLWQGQLDKTSYKYSVAGQVGEKELKFQSPAAGGLGKFKDTPKFSAVGLSDEYVVVSFSGRTLFFITKGTRAGDLVMYDPHDGMVDKFVFSQPNNISDGATASAREGGQLVLGLMRKGSKTAQARIYNTRLFPLLNPENRNLPVSNNGVCKVSPGMFSEVSLQYEHFPKGATFSASGTMLAIHSNANSKGTSTLWLLCQSEGKQWELSVKQEIEVLSADVRARATGTHIGITGLALYFPRAPIPRHSYDGI